MHRPLIALLLVAAVVACNDGEGVAPTYIHAQVGGKYWSGPASEGTVVYPGGAPDGAGLIYTVATHSISGGKEFLSLDLPTTPSIGSYPLDGISAFATFAACPDQDLADCIYWKPVAGHAGTLSITHVDPATGLIEGTFSFTGYLLRDTTKATKSITEGQFSITAGSVFLLE